MFEKRGQGDRRRSHGNAFERYKGAQQVIEPRARAAWVGRGVVFVKGARAIDARQTARCYRP